MAGEFVSQYTKCIVTGEEVGLVCIVEKEARRVEDCIAIQLVYCDKRGWFGWACHDTVRCIVTWE